MYLAVCTKGEAKVFLVIEGGASKKGSRTESSRYSSLGREMVEEFHTVEDHVGEHDRGYSGVRKGVSDTADLLLDHPDTPFSFGDMFIGTGDINPRTLGEGLKGALQRGKFSIKG